MATGSISTPGIGSGLPIDDTIAKLMAVERRPLTTLATKEASYQAKLSAYGALSGALSSFRTAMTDLGKASTFQALTSNIGDSDIFGATTGTSAMAGSYRINVTQLAQEQILTSGGQSSRTAQIGSGASTTISFQFGTISGGTLTDGKYTGATFAQDADVESGSVTIDASNNTLQGIRDAINAANVGVTATLISDGSATPEHLVLTSNKTGVTSSMKISVDGDPALQALLGYDPAGTQSLQQTSVAQNASLTVNGIAITSAENKVTEAIQGVTLDLKKTGESTLSVTANRSAVKDGINKFVNAYNELANQLKSLTAYNPETKTGGLLLGDATTRSIQDSIRRTLSASLEGLSNSSLSLSSIGVAFQKDGSLALDSSKLDKALANNFNDIASLFATVGKASDSLINFNTSSANTKAGSYELNITQLATQATLKGDATIAASTTIASNTELKVKIDGVEATVKLTAGTYSAKQLAAMLQSAINGSSKLAAADVAVAVVVEDGQLKVTSDRYGSASNISIDSSSGTPASTLFGTVKAGSEGVDVAGTIGGQAATGSGRFLTAAKGTDADGLKIEITGGTTGARGTLDFSQGYADRLGKLVDSFIGAEGLISSRTDGINSSIKNIGKQSEALNARLAMTEANYRRQFGALDLMIAQMQQTQNYLMQQLAQIANMTSQS